MKPSSRYLKLKYGSFNVIWGGKIISLWDSVGQDRAARNVQSDPDQQFPQTVLDSHLHSLRV